MTIDLVNPGLWGVGDKLTSAQQNALDANTSYALDKRSGETDDLESIVQNVGAGRIVPSVYTGPDADATIDMATGIQIVRSPTLTAARTYTLATTTAVAGDMITVIALSGMYNLTVKTGATTLRVLGGTTGAESLVATFIYNATTVAWERTTARGPSFAVEEFAANGTFTSLSWVNGVLLVGCGGGSGGGTGAGNGVTTDEWWCGGGGGGSAIQSMVYVTVTPSTGYAVTIGGGGTGGVGGASYSPATGGGDTTFGSTATFKGAAAATSATNAGSHKTTASTSYMLAHGGKPSSGLLSYHNATPGSFGFTAWNTATMVGFSALQLVNQIIGEGGPGGTSNYLSGLGAGPGATCNAGGYAGGARGAKGADSGSYRGGGGGGGGAAGPFGAGGAGGAGSDANSAGASSAGTNGTSAAANTGAGGGGGGAAGAANAGSGGFSNYNSSGGNGGSGRLFVIYPVQTS